MYNRYIPNADGVYERQIMHTPQKKASQPSHAKDEAQVASPQARHPAQKMLLPQLDGGDILVLLILLLVLTEGEDADPMTVLITLAAFLLLQ